MSSNFELLQQRCKKLKLKERLRYMGTVFAVTAVAGLLFFYDTEEPPSSPPQPETVQNTVPKAQTKSRPPAQTVQAAVQPTPQKEEQSVPVKSTNVQEEKRAYTLHVDNSYLQTLERPKESAPKPAAVAEKSEQTPPAPKAKAAEPVVKAAVAEPKEETAVVEVAEKAAPKPAIEMKLSTNSLENMLEEYEQKPTYQRALNIADIYFDRGDFNQCAVWAKKANLLQKDDAAAWIMFARAEYAKGKKAKAIRILELFLNNKNSVEAESLLLTWRQEG